MPRIAVARREASLGLTIRTPRKSSNACRFYSPPASILRRAAAVFGCDRGILTMIYYNKVWRLRTPFAGSVRVQILVVWAALIPS